MSPVSVQRIPLPVPADVARAYFEHARAESRLAPPWRSHVPWLPGEVVREYHDAGETSVLEERVTWHSPGGAPAVLVESAVQLALQWRHRVSRLDLTRWAQRGGRPLRVGITGASGMLGRALTEYLELQGCAVRPFVRRPAAGPGEISWDPRRGKLDAAALSSLDAVVHLAGAGIADERWTPERKRELVDSRVLSTVLLAKRIAEARTRPVVLLSASAIGIYGDRGEEALDESSGAGSGFLADLGRAWESAATPAVEAGVRVAHPRIGVVLWPRGGALAKLLTPVRFGAGGPLGSGAQWWSWVTLHELLDQLLFALEQPVEGAFNAVAPAPVRQREMAATLGRVLHRPSIAPAPAFVLRWILGEMADEALLASQNLTPRVLAAAGYRHRDPALEGALRGLLGRPGASA